MSSLGTVFIHPTGLSLGKLASLDAKLVYHWFYHIGPGLSVDEPDEPLIGIACKRRLQPENMARNLLLK